MIEPDDALGAALKLDQRLHLRVVDAADFILVVEFLHFGVVANETKAMALKHKILRVWPAIVNGDAARIRRAARASISAARTGDDCEDFAAIVDDVIECGLNSIGREVEFGGLGCGFGHGELPVVASI